MYLNQFLEMRETCKDSNQASRVETAMSVMRTISLYVTADWMLQEDTLINLKITFKRKHTKNENKM